MFVVARLRGVSAAGIRRVARDARPATRKSTKPPFMATKTAIGIALARLAVVPPGFCSPESGPEPTVRPAWQPARPALASRTASRVFTTAAGAIALKRPAEADGRNDQFPQFHAGHPRPAQARPSGPHRPRADAGGVGDALRHAHDVQPDAGRHDDRARQLVARTIASSIGVALCLAIHVLLKRAGSDRPWRLLGYAFAAERACLLLLPGSANLSSAISPTITRCTPIAGWRAGN